MRRVAVWSSCLQLLLTLNVLLVSWCRDSTRRCCAVNIGSSIAEIKEDILNLGSKSSNTGESDYFGGK